MIPLFFAVFFSGILNREDWVGVALSGWHAHPLAPPPDFRGHNREVGQGQGQSQGGTQYQSISAVDPNFTHLCSGSGIKVLNTIVGGVGANRVDFAWVSLNLSL